MNFCSRIDRLTLAARNALFSIALVSIGMFVQFPGTAQIPPGKPSSGLMNPRAIAFNPKTGKVYAVDTNNGAVDVYDDARQRSLRVKVGAEPVSLAVNTATGRVYVANAGDGSVTVLDGSSDSVSATIPIGSHPYSIAANSVTNKVYVTHTFGDQLRVIDGAANTVTDIKTGSSDLIAIDSRTGTIFLLGYGSAVKELDGPSHQITDRPVGKHAWALALNELSGALYVTRIEDASVASIDRSSSEPAVFSAGAIPCSIAVNAKFNKLYVANYGGNSISVIDAKTGHTEATVPVGDHPKAVAYDPGRDLVYAANTLGNSITVIDATSHAVLATIPAGRSPYALAVVPGSSRLYVANEADGESSTVVDVSQFHKAAH